MGKLILGNITIAESGGSGGVTKAYVDSEISRVEGEIPSLTGYATTAYVDGEISTLSSVVDTKFTKPLNSSWNIIAVSASSNEIKCNTDFTPSSTNNSKNFASLGTVRNFYDDLKDYTDTGLSGKFDSSAVWTGTQAQWDALTSAQKASYTIALIR